LKSIQERVKKNYEGKLSKTEREQLATDCKKYAAKRKTNTYTKKYASKAEALLKELNNSSKQETANSSEFP